MILFVENIAKEVTEEDLSSLFSKYGFIEHIHVSEYLDKQGAMAIIEMPLDKCAFEAIRNLNKMILYGKKMMIFSSFQD